VDPDGGRLVEVARTASKNRSMFGTKARYARQVSWNRFNSASTLPRAAPERYEIPSQQLKYATALGVHEHIVRIAACRRCRSGADSPHAEKPTDFRWMAEYTSTVTARLVEGQ